MYKYYLVVNGSYKGFNDYAEALKEKAWFENLGYSCTIKYR